jgi:cellulose synthase (UDP-forming)
MQVVTATSSQVLSATSAKITEVRSLRVFRGWDYVLFGVLTAAQLVVIAYLAKGWLFHGATSHPILFVIMVGLLGSVVGVQLLRWFLLPKMRRPVPMPASPGWKVAVATTFVPGAESLEMLQHSLQALVNMDYPHDTWVLDEGDSEEVRKLCQALGAHHFSRKSMPQYQMPAGTFQARTKHGNYNAWLHEIGFNRYDIIVGFDPDHVAEATYLTAALGYFDDPRVGYVQFPQVYYNQTASFIAAGAAEETYAYYGCTQLAAYAGGWPIITGCHHAHRSTALKQFGGFAPHDADDMLTTFLYRQQGWQGVYSPEVQARGLTPVDWSGYLNQQLRWARSVLDIKFRIQPRLDTHLPLIERILSLVHGLSYLQGIPVLVGTLLIAYMLATGYVPPAGGGGFFAMLLALALLFKCCDFYRQRFFLLPRREWGLHWRCALLQYAKWPFLVAALIDVILNRKVAYSLTPKVPHARRRRPLVWAHGAIVALLAGAWAVGAATGSHPHVSVGFWAWGLSIASIVLIITDLVPSPPPYDAKLWESTRAKSPA